MRIAVVGPGALGLLFASFLTLRSDHDHEIWIVDHDEKRAADLSAGGLKLIEESNCQQLRIKVATAPEAIGHADLILLCVKSPDVRRALALLNSLAAEDSLLIALQNGIAHHAILAEYPGPWAVGITAQGASLIAPGVVKHGGSGKTMVGFLAGAKSNQALLHQAAAALNQAGLQTEVSNEILTHIWRKFIVNIGINALTVLFDCPNGQLLSSVESRGRMAALTREAVSVAAARGIRLPDDPVAMVEAVCRATATNVSSMLQDVRRRKPTEIDAINGALVAEAERLRLAVPENRQVVRQIKNIESQYIISSS